MRDLNRFSRDKLGDLYQDKTGALWQFKSLCERPTIVMVPLEGGKEMIVSIDSSFAHDMKWVKAAEAQRK